MPFSWPDAPLPYFSARLAAMRTSTSSLSWAGRQSVITMKAKPWSPAEILTGRWRLFKKP